MERMIEADQTMLLLSLQREMAEMKRKTEETAQKNEQELQVLRRENEEMKKKLGREDLLSNRRTFSASPTPLPSTRIWPRGREADPLPEKPRWMTNLI